MGAHRTRANHGSRAGVAQPRDRGSGGRARVLARVQPRSRTPHRRLLGAGLGGPPVYTDTMGDESGMVRMHSGDGEHDEMDERAEACFMAAAHDVELPQDICDELPLASWS